MSEQTRTVTMTETMFQTIMDALDEKSKRLVMRARIMDGEIIKTHEMPNRWEYRQIDDAPIFLRDRWYCPDCHSWQTYGEPAFCPMCGAYMLIDEEEKKNADDE